MSNKAVVSIFCTLFSFQAFASSDTVCIRADLPSGKSDALILVFDGTEGRLARLSRGPGAPVQASLLAKNLKCVRAESDARVVNCLRPTPAGSVMKSDATFTILRQRTLSAGPIEREEGDRGEAVTENYAIYFRDDQSKSDLKWTLGYRQCREATAQERALVLGL